MTTALVETGVERDQVIETVTRLFIYTDDRDWPGVKALFTDRVLFDMTSMAGGLPASVTAQEIVDGWDRGLRNLKAIHHQVGNFLVDIDSNGGSAEVFCYGIAWHYLPNKTGRNSRTFLGSYQLHLTKVNEVWKIDRFRFNLKFIDGNPELEKS